MRKLEKEAIKEVVEELLKARNWQMKMNEFVYRDQAYYKIDSPFRKELIKNRQETTFEIFDKPLIKLNKLLEFKDQYEEVLEIEKEMARIQAKRIISVKEFIEIYGDSKKTQENLRGRLNDPLAYRQKVEGGKISYVVEEVEKWLENQHR